MPSDTDAPFVADVQRRGPAGELELGALGGTISATCGDSEALESNDGPSSLRQRSRGLDLCNDLEPLAVAAGDVLVRLVATGTARNSELVGAANPSCLLKPLGGLSCPVSLTLFLPDVSWIHFAGVLTGAWNRTKIRRPVGV